MKTIVTVTMGIIALMCFAADSESITAFLLSKVAGVAISYITYLCYTKWDGVKFIEEEEQL